MKTIGIIGFGNMGRALYKGLETRADAYVLLAAEHDAEKAAQAQKESGVRIVSNEELASGAEIIIIAVKPQELPRLVSEIGGFTRNKKVISVVAGKKTDYFSGALHTDQVVRFMPNLAASAGCAAVGVSPGPRANAGFERECLEIARAVGTPYLIPENLMSAITGLSGSGIAYVFAFVHALALGGVESGFKYDQALDISLTTLEGALAVLKSSKNNPIEWLSRVVSPAGTTIRGVAALEELGFTHAVMKAVRSAAERAAELEA
jgi:pyrroline-5-carboxylate reductase